jgi:hypothetical protein
MRYEMDLMARSATDIIQEIINAAVVDAIVALKGSAQGLPNALLRDLNAIHSNTAFSDLPDPVQKAVAASVRSAFSKLQREGYVVAEAKSVQAVATNPPSHRSKGHANQSKPAARPGLDRRPPPKRGPR